MSNKADECVKVVVRIRPMNSEEERNGNLMYALNVCFELSKII